MKEEIPESFWEALVEVKDIDINNARELFQTAMELAKKYKDERDEAREALDRIEGGSKMSFTPQIIELTDGIKCVSLQDYKKLEQERDEYKIGHDRYEKLRRLNLQQIKELYLRNLRTGEHFDTLVDKL